MDRLVRKGWELLSVVGQLGLMLMGVVWIAQYHSWMLSIGLASLVGICTFADIWYSLEEEGYFEKDDE